MSLDSYTLNLDHTLPSTWVFYIHSLWICGFCLVVIKNPLPGSCAQDDLVMRSKAVVLVLKKRTLFFPLQLLYLSHADPQGKFLEPSKVQLAASTTLATISTFLSFVYERCELFFGCKISIFGHKKWRSHVKAMQITTEKAFHNLSPSYTVINHTESQMACCSKLVLRLGGTKVGWLNISQCHKVCVCVYIPLSVFWQVWGFQC